MENLNDLIAQAEEIIASPEDRRYEPVLLLKLLVAIAREVQT